MIALGGWIDSENSQKYSTLVGDPAARQTFITNVIDFIETHNFDGLDLDWEFPRCWTVSQYALKYTRIIYDHFCLYQIAVCCLTFKQYVRPAVPGVLQVTRKISHCGLRN